MKPLLLTAISCLIFLPACMNHFKFRADENNSAPGNEVSVVPPGVDPDSGNPKPDTPPPIVDPDTEPRPFQVTYKKGNCTKDKLEVLPCLSCQITQEPISIPLSVKAAELLQIMTSGCAIRNKSDPIDYQPPSRSQLLKYLNRADSNNYPASVPTMRQKFHLEKWSESNQDYLKKIFGGLWYHPPYSDDFETYFGIEPKEARYFFCYGAEQSSFGVDLSTPLYSLEYYQCIHNGFAGNCQEKPEYREGNVYRDQLVESIRASLDDPFNDQELVPANKCLWETMAGSYNLEMETKLLSWKNKGYEMAIYFETQNPRCEKLSLVNIPMNAKVIVAGKLCTEL